MSTETISLSPTPAPAASRRLVYVDAIRGFLLAFMAVNHIPSDLQTFTNHPLGFVSAAEGFVFMSGLMIGLVYSKKYYKAGVEAMSSGILARARSIYIFHVVTFALILLGAHLCLTLSGAAPTLTPVSMIEHPWRSLATSLILLQQPSLFDILPMYCVLLFVAPGVIIACARGQRTAVLIGSFGIWLLANLASPQNPVIKGMVNTGSFNLLAWQLLFVFGLSCGNGWASGDRFWPQPTARLTLLVGILAALLFALRHALVPSLIPGGWIDWAANKNNVAPLRLLNAGLLYYLVYVLASRFPRALSSEAFAFLGQHSMFVFAAHIVVAYTLFAFPSVFVESAVGRALGTIVMLASLFGAALLHQKFTDRRKVREKGPDEKSALASAR